MTTGIKSSFFLILFNVLVQLSCSPDQKVNDSPEKPNVLIISVDDLKDWVGFMGGYEGNVFTPNIDALAAKGVAFTNAHTAATVCCPSRNAFMLGKRPSTTGLYDNGQWYKAALPNEVAIPQYFKMNGYYTAGAGKVFHHTPGNNPPCNWNEFQEQVFDDPWNFSEWDPDRYFLTYGYRGEIIKYPSWKPLNGILPIRSELDWGPIPGKKEEDYGDQYVVEYARDFFKKDLEKPFLLALGTYRPHLPWHVPKKYFDLYPLSEIVLPEYLPNDLKDVPIAGQELAKSGSKDFFQIKDEDKLKKAIQAYLASISFADDMVGQILSALENSQFRENTIVVLWSDHGWHLGTKDHWHKQTLWEECTRIPFIIKSPGVNAAVCNKPVDMVNVFPTLVSMCGLPEKEGLDGYDMTPLISESSSDNWDYPAVTEIKHGNVSVRDMEWRYIRYKDGSEELYNLNDDPKEWKNLASKTEYQDVIDSLAKWIPESFHEPVPGKNQFFFDPYQYTWIARESGEFIDGNK